MYWFSAICDTSAWIGGLTDYVNQFLVLLIPRELDHADPGNPSGPQENDQVGISCGPQSDFPQTLCELKHSQAHQLRQKVAKTN